MVPVNPLDQIKWLFHFTDSRNLPLIREKGGIYSKAKLDEMGVTVYTGGNQWSLDADKKSGMDKYVHLCFKGKHPMEYLARQEKRIEKSVFIFVNPEVLQLPGVLYSPGVSNKSGIQTCTIEEAATKIDYEVLYTYMDWRKPDIQERRQAAEKCEILVPDYVPIKFLEKHILNG